MREPKFVVTVCCQGQPFYYFYNNLLSAIIGFSKHYCKKKKYGTMRFTLDELYDVDKPYKEWLKQKGENSDK